jgi:hypothetical protein
MQAIHGGLWAAFVFLLIGCVLLARVSFSWFPSIPLLSGTRAASTSAPKA